jgi:hypothetical protein
MARDMSGVTWVKSSRSSDPDLAQCVEVAEVTGTSVNLAA